MCEICNGDLHSNAEIASEMCLHCYVEMNQEA